ncbi:MAG TPA: hypothetical protein VGA81_19875, partial [Methylomirabilota bacterium]
MLVESLGPVVRTLIEGLLGLNRELEPTLEVVELGRRRGGSRDRSEREQRRRQKRGHPAHFFRSAHDLPLRFVSVSCLGFERRASG